VDEARAGDRAAGIGHSILAFLARTPILGRGINGRIQGDRKKVDERDVSRPLCSQRSQTRPYIWNPFNLNTCVIFANEALRQAGLMRKLLVISLVVSLLLSLGANLYLLLLLLDAGIQLDNVRSEVDRLSERRQLALDLLNRHWVGRTVDEVDGLAKELSEDGVLIGREGELREIGEFVFYVESGTVTEVRDFDSWNPPVRTPP
jgi:hypothetical protein